MKTIVVKIDDLFYQISKSDKEELDNMKIRHLNELYYIKEKLKKEYLPLTIESY